MYHGSTLTPRWEVLTPNLRIAWDGSSLLTIGANFFTIEPEIEGGLFEEIVVSRLAMVEQSEKRNRHGLGELLLLGFAWRAILLRTLPSDARVAECPVDYGSDLDMNAMKGLAHAWNYTSRCYVIMVVLLVKLLHGWLSSLNNILFSCTHREKKGKREETPWFGIGLQN